MNRIVVKSLLILIAGLAIAFQAEAQGLKTKRLNTKALLAIERQRTDSLTSVIEEYKKRESDWQKAWYEEKEEKRRIRARSLPSTIAPQRLTR